MDRDLMIILATVCRIIVTWWLIFSVLSHKCRIKDLEQEVEELKGKK